MIQSIFEEVMSAPEKGHLADYIPALANQPKDLFAVYIIDEKGEVLTFGDFNVVLTLQSISKVMSFIVAADNLGIDQVLEKVDVEPTGDPFNSIVRLEVAEKGKPFNPMINAGAITVASLLPGENVEARVKSVTDFISQVTAREHSVNQEVFQSEMETAYRNRAIANYLKANDYLRGTVEEALETYLQLCSIELTTEDLAKLGLFICSDGLLLTENKSLITRKTARYTKALMMTCGLYNASGKYAATIGMPMKSGVSGGVLCTVQNGQIEHLQGRMGIGVFSPMIDEIGNSVKGMDFLQKISEHYNLSVF
ncbi:glutaminase A [Ureibacillus chungkukjangi]|uniref:Glutaminase n=1 Tax=Ureibacillus chungkukjangi TaxID=1202712 RepID=A0A318UA50_9BACL|nr:glutaminase A [Ureibacillus chungkukjangi]PYF08949.1 L-glutaminase [Ureibacillus chungkukjangi]